MSYSGDNPTVREKVHKNCWECDNIAKGLNTCKCASDERRRRKRRAKQRFRRELRNGHYDY